MSHSDPEYPPVNVSYELRCTQRALADLDAEDAIPSDLESIVGLTQRRDIVSKFFDQRSEVPTGTEAPLKRMGRPDIYSLHGPVGERAATWFDKANDVCWLLGVVPEHNYVELENRSKSDELLPSQRDYELLFIARDNFDDLVTPGLADLIDSAVNQPEVPQRGEVGSLLRIEVSAVAIAIDETDVTDLYLLVRLPPRSPEKEQPKGWPGNELMERLAELATGCTFSDLTTEVPISVPNGVDLQRRVQFDLELAILIHDFDY